MSSASLAVHANGVLPWGTDRAEGPEGRQVTKELRRVLEDLWVTESVGAPVRGRREALYEVALDCATGNWDGYGAMPAKGSSIGWAERFLQILPRDIEDPEVAFTPTGDVLLEWRSTNGGMLSLSIGSSGELRFAARTPGRKLTGIETLSDEIPESLARALSWFVG